MTTQQRTALDKANVYRLMQADLKRSLRGLSMVDGKRVVTDVIRDPAPELGAMRVESLLRAVRAVGHEKARMICRRSQVIPTRRVGALTDGERDRLDRVLR